RVADPEVHTDSSCCRAVLPDPRAQGIGILAVGHPLPHHQIVIKASLYGHPQSLRLDSFALRDPSGAEFQLTDKQLRQAGYRLELASDCAVRLVYGEWSSYAVCAAGAGRAAERLVSERSGAAGAGY